MHPSLEGSAIVTPAGKLSSGCTFHKLIDLYFKINLIYFVVSAQWNNSFLYNTMSLMFISSKRIRTLLCEETL